MKGQREGGGGLVGEGEIIGCELERDKEEGGGDYSEKIKNRHATKIAYSNKRIKRWIEIRVHCKHIKYTAYDDISDNFITIIYVQ